MLGKIQTQADLENATTTTGERIFTNLEGTKLAETAAFLSKFPAMVKSCDERSAEQNLDEPPKLKEDFQMVYKTDGKGNGEFESGWDAFKEVIEIVVDEAKHLIADALRWIKGAVKKIAKFAIRVVGEIVSFVFWVGAKALRFVIKHVGPLLSR